MCIIGLADNHLRGKETQNVHFLFSEVLEVSVMSSSAHKKEPWIFLDQFAFTALLP